MGSCLSKKKPIDASSPLPPSLSPPLPEEEAVVKEVLTETPTPSSFLTARPTSTGKGQPQPTAPAGGEETRRASEKRGEAGEEEAPATPPPTKWCRPEWSPAGKSCSPLRNRYTYSGELLPARRPAGAINGGARSSPSPVKRPDGRASAGREARNGSEGYGCYGSGRRSVSPAAKRAGDARGGGGVRRNLSSPQRAHPPPSVATAAGSSIRRTAAAGEGGEGAAALPAPEKVESVENPLISLECFIFL